MKTIRRNSGSAETFLLIIISVLSMLFAAQMTTITGKLNAEKKVRTLLKNYLLTKTWGKDSDRFINDDEICAQTSILTSLPSAPIDVGSFVPDVPLTSPPAKILATLPGSYVFNDGGYNRVIKPLGGSIHYNVIRFEIVQLQKAFRAAPSRPYRIPAALRTHITENGTPQIDDQRVYIELDGSGYPIACYSGLSSRGQCLDLGKSYHESWFPKCQ